MKATLFKKVKKIGSSYIITLDKEDREILGILEGDTVRIEIELIRPSDLKR